MITWLDNQATLPLSPKSTPSASLTWCLATLWQHRLCLSLGCQHKKTQKVFHLHNRQMYFTSQTFTKIWMHCFEFIIWKMKEFSQGSLYYANKSLKFWILIYPQDLLYNFISNFKVIFVKLNPSYFLFVFSALGALTSILLGLLPLALCSISTAAELLEMW